MSVHRLNQCAIACLIYLSVYPLRQVLLGRECTEKVDIFSLGIVLWEISTGDSPDGRRLRPVKYAQSPNLPPSAATLLTVLLQAFTLPLT